MDIDKLFKVPKLPAKRKLPDQPTPELLKKLRTEEPPSMPPPATPNKGKSRAVTIEEVPDDDADSNPADFAPGGDADYFVEEDDEGRFFGGGLTTEQKDILNIFDHAGGEGVQEDVDALSLPAIRKLLTKFERVVNKNQDQRSKYPDDPTKFIDSEADLDASLKALLPLAQVPTVAYPELVKSGTLTILIGLLSHENADIVIDVVEVIHELTDEDVGGDADEVDEGDLDPEEALKMLIETLLENSILELLVDNLKRLNETEESDRQGVFHILGVFENMVGFDPKLATTLVEKTAIMPWLLQRVQEKKHDENRGYAAELLSILLQNNPQNREQFCKQDGIEVYLNVLSQFRRRDPVDADETEFMENIFNGLCSALGVAEGKKLFIAAEGPDLMVIFMQERPVVCTLAIKAMDYAMSAAGEVPVCETFVECAGLKPLFSVFMGKVGKKSKIKLTTEDMSHILGIMSSMLSTLASETPARIRLLAKFVENEYDKVERLLEIRTEAQTRLKGTEKKIARVKQNMVDAEEDITEDEELQWYLDRLDGGLFTLQHTDYILAWIMMEDDGVRAHAQRMLSRNNLSLKDIVGTLQVYHDNVDDDAEGSSPQKDILNNLIAVLGELI